MTKFCWTRTLYMMSIAVGWDAVLNNSKFKSLHWATCSISSQLMLTVPFRQLLFVHTIACASHLRCRKKLEYVITGARLTLVHFSSVGFGSTSATQPSCTVLVSGTICRRTSDSRTCHTAVRSGSRWSGLRLRNDLYCVEWGVKLYSLTHSRWSGNKAQCESTFHCALES